MIAKLYITSFPLLIFNYLNYFIEKILTYYNFNYHFFKKINKNLS